MGIYTSKVENYIQVISCILQGIRYSCINESTLNHGNDSLQSLSEGFGSLWASAADMGPRH